MNNKKRTIQQAYSDIFSIKSEVRELSNEIEKLNSTTLCKENKLAYEIITEASKEQLSEESMSIRDVFLTFGKLPALNARYGSFDNLIKELNLSETGIVSLFGFYLYSGKDRKTLVILTPDDLEHRPYRGTFSIQLKNKKELVFDFRKQEQSQLVMYSDVQIGLDQKNRKPYIIKVKYPLNILCIDVVDSINKVGSLSFNEQIQCRLTEKYPESIAISDIFSKSIVNSGSVVRESNRFNDAEFISASQKVYDNRLRKAKSNS